MEVGENNGLSQTTSMLVTKLLKLFEGLKLSWFPRAYHYVQENVSYHTKKAFTENVVKHTAVNLTN